MKRRNNMHYHLVTGRESAGTIGRGVRRYHHNNASNSVPILLVRGFRIRRGKVRTRRVPARGGQRRRHRAGRVEKKRRRLSSEQRARTRDRHRRKRRPCVAVKITPRAARVPNNRLNGRPKCPRPISATPRRNRARTGVIRRTVSAHHLHTARLRGGGTVKLKWGVLARNVNGIKDDGNRNVFPVKSVRRYLTSTRSRPRHVGHRRRRQGNDTRILHHRLIVKRSAIRRRMKRTGPRGRVSQQNGSVLFVTMLNSINNLVGKRGVR